MVPATAAAAASPPSAGTAVPTAAIPATIAGAASPDGKMDYLSVYATQVMDPNGRTRYW